MKKIKIIKMVMIIFLAFTRLNSAYAGSSGEGGHQWWIDLGLGVGGGSKMGGGTALIDANYRNSEFGLLTVRALQTDEFLGQDNFTEVGVLYGLIAKGKYGYASASAGVGWVQYKEAYGQIVGLFSREHIRTYNTVGIPVELQFFVTPTPFVGVGIIGFSNINPANTVSGGVLALQFGNLW